MLLLLLIHIDHLKTADIASILGLKSNRAAKKWLYDNGIPINKIGNKNVVCQFSFEFKRQQIVVEELRKRYPTNWFEIYDANTEDKGMVKSILALYPKTKAVNKTKKNRIKKYIE